MWILARGVELGLTVKALPVDATGVRAATLGRTVIGVAPKIATTLRLTFGYRVAGRRRQRAADRGGAALVSSGYE